jgi:hypothetical protein
MSTEAVRRFPELPAVLLSAPCAQITPLWAEGYMGLAVRHERKGIRAISIDAELLSERTSLGQLDRHEAKIAAAITFAHEAAAARA